MECVGLYSALMRTKMRQKIQYKVRLTWNGGVAAMEVSYRKATLATISIAPLPCEQFECLFV